jgi:hypothetical protein
MRSRPGSKRGQIQTAFLTGGLEEALRVGRDLKWSESGIKSWCKKWGEESLSVKPRTEGKREVCLSYWPEKKGVIVAPGPEVSGVRFSDGTHRFIPNGNLVDL